MAAHGVQVPLAEGYFVPNQRGGLNLIHDGRVHHRDNFVQLDNNRWQAYWRCKGCEAHRMKTEATTDNRILSLVSFSSHSSSCQRDELAIAAEQARLGFLEEARNPAQLLSARNALRQTFNQARSGLDADVQVALGQYENHANSARRHRSHALYGGIPSPNGGIPGLGRCRCVPTTGLGRGLSRVPAARHKRCRIHAGPGRCRRWGVDSAGLGVGGCCVSAGWGR